MTDHERIEKLAVRLAERDMVEWEKLTDFMKNAYRHNAEVLITPVEVVPIEAQSAADTEAAAKAQAEARAALHEAEKMAGPEIGVVEVSGVIEPSTVSDANDNEEQWAEAAAKTGATKVLSFQGEEVPDDLGWKLDTFLCSKCKANHKADSKIGLRHLKYKA